MPNIILAPADPEREYLEAFDGIHTNGIGTVLYLDVPGILLALPFILGFMKKAGFTHITVTSEKKLSSDLVPSFTTLVSFYDIDPGVLFDPGFKLEESMLPKIWEQVEAAVNADHARCETAKTIMKDILRDAGKVMEVLMEINDWKTPVPDHLGTLAEYQYRVPGEFEYRTRALKRYGLNISLEENGRFVSIGTDAVLSYKVPEIIAKEK